jgi:hypothetical protein
MFELVSGGAAYRRVGFALTLLYLGLFVYGFPPFHVGLWVQIEPMLLAVFVFSYATAAWLALGVAKGWLSPQSSAPLWWCLVLWVLWQMIPTLLATTPWRSWFGPPELGEGMASQLALILMIMLFYPYLLIKKYRDIFFTSGVAIIVLLVSLHQWVPIDVTADEMGGDANRWVSSRFSKDLPFIAGYLWIAFMCFQTTLKKSHYFILLLSFAVLLWLCNNRTAIVLMGGALLVSSAFILLPQRFSFVSRAWRGAACIGCLVPFLWVAFSVNIGTLQIYVDRLDSSKASAGITDHFYLSNKDGTIGGRVPFLQVAMSAMQHDPKRWLVGDGWGRFTDDTYRYALVDEIYAYKDGKAQSNWEAVWGRPMVHSHCMPIEALLSLGIPGMLLWLAIPMLAIVYMPKPLFWSVVPMVVAMTMVAYFWFDIVQDMPFRALVLAALCQVSIRRIRLQPRIDIVVVVLVVSCMLMGWSAWQQRDAINYAQRLRYALVTSSAGDFKQEWLLEDAKRGGDRLRQSALLYGGLVEKNSKMGMDDPSDMQWYWVFLQATRSYAELEHSNPHAASTEMWLGAKLFNNLYVPAFAPLRAQMAERLPETILLVSAKAPLRDDIASPFLTKISVFMRGDHAKQIEFTRKLLAINPDHRGALWVLGNILKNISGKEAEGQAMLRRAKALRVEQVYPVTKEELANVH